MVEILYFFFFGANVEDRHGLEFILRITVLADCRIIHFNKALCVIVLNPCGKGVVTEEQPEHLFVFAKCIFRAASLDCESDMTTDGAQKFQIANVVRVFILVMLDDQDTDGCGGCSQRDAEPRRRRRPNELDFAFRREPVEFVLRNQHWRSRAENKRGAAASYLLRCRRRVDLVGKKWKGKRIRLLIMEGHEAIFRVNNFFQRQMDAVQQLIQVCSLVEGMYDLGEDLTLRFHPVKISDIPKTKDNAVQLSQVGIITGRGINPAPSSFFALEAAASARLPVLADRQIAKAFASSLGIACVNQVKYRFSDKIFGEVPKHTGKSSACKLNDSVRVENRDQFLDRVQQYGKLLRANDGPLREGGTLVHVVAARYTRLCRSAQRARVLSASSVRD